MITYTFPADSSPGEIYLSIVDVPTDGCWHVTFEWNGHRADLSLLLLANRATVARENAKG